MKCITMNLILILLFFIGTISQIKCTCVLESDFGFSLNCNFKKAGLFRVRNLGGVKAHFGLGFSVGDELGFPESLGNVEGNRRRALNLRNGANAFKANSVTKKAATAVVANINQSRPKAVTSSDQMIQMQKMVPRPIVSTPEGFKKPNQMTEATSLPLGVPAFKPIPHDIINVKDKISRLQKISLPKNYGSSHNQVGSSTTNMPSTEKYHVRKSLTETTSSSSIDKRHSRISLVQDYQTKRNEPIAQSLIQIFDNEELPQVDLKGHTVEELATAANVSTEVIQTAIKMRQKQMLFEKRKNGKRFDNKMNVNYATSQTNFLTPLKMTSATITSSKIDTTTSRSTTPFVNIRKLNRQKISGGHKVMNAPKEYYPIGYDKNFDDNFKSKVELPTTTFHCGNQKHFPGLYADEDLGCMVFHVCALTDDGLVMKSFLCPESTLFDQTILKCNWWFYTDCKSSKLLYDSNLPVSKSYQLMKSLAFFNSNYKKPGNSTNDPIDNGINVEALNNSLHSKSNV